MPNNESAHRLQASLKRFRGVYQGRRQPALAARIRDPKGTKSAGGESPSPTRQKAAWSGSCYAAGVGERVRRRAESRGVRRPTLHSACHWRATWHCRRARIRSGLPISSVTQTPRRRLSTPHRRCPRTMSRSPTLASPEASEDRTELAKYANANGTAGGIRTSIARCLKSTERRGDCWSDPRVSDGFWSQDFCHPPAISLPFCETMGARVLRQMGTLCCAN